jgi:hypothetical protein
MEDPIVSKSIDAILTITARAWQTALHEVKPSSRSASHAPIKVGRRRSGVPQLAPSMLDFEKTHHEA